MSRPDDDPHDAYLKQALRHAPDAGVAPPPALSEAILRAARSAAEPAALRAAAPPARAGLVAALLALWNWLAQPRVATGCASVMVATLAGVMWWGRPIEPPLDLPAAPVRENVQASAPPDPPAAVLAQSRLNEPPAPESQLRDAAKAKSSDRALQAAAPPRRDRSVAAPPAVAQRSAPEPMAAAPAEPPLPPSPAAPPGLLKQRAEAYAAPAMEAVASEARVAAARAIEAPATEARADAAAASTGASVVAAAPPAAVARGSAIGRLRADIAAAPERWQWRWADGEPRVADAALLEWLARVDAAATRAPGTVTATALGAAPAKSAAADAAAPALLLLVDGKPQRLVQIAADRVRLTAPDGKLRLLDAALPPMVAIELRSSIEAMAR